MTHGWDTSNRTHQRSGYAATHDPAQPPHLGGVVSSGARDAAHQAKAQRNRTPRAPNTTTAALVDSERAAAASVALLSSERAAVLWTFGCGHGVGETELGTRSERIMFFWV